MSESGHVVFLYSELAGYFIASLKRFATPETPVTVFHWPVNSEAPFDIPHIPHVQFIDRSAWDRSGMLEEIDRLRPKVILCSGWMDKEYIEVMKVSRARRVLLLDNQWNGSLRQRLRIWTIKNTVKRAFDGAWVPGEPQRKYAKRLGINVSEIHTGFYVADTTNFPQSRSESVPKRWVYVGRYVRHKGIFDLWDAFESLAATYPDWTLHCIGTGEEWASRRLHPQIVHHGFLQPSELAEFLSEGGLFVLPSLFEPWGVVVQEMALLGMPMVVSSKVGAASLFCKEDNATPVDPGDKKALARAMASMMGKNNEELLHMSKASQRQGRLIDQATWADTLRHML